MSDQEPAGISQPFLNRVIKGTRGAEILPGGKYDIPRPEEYDLSVFPEEDRDVVDVAVKQLSAYLGYPMITDNFPNHNIRRTWRGQTSKFLHNRYGPEASRAFEKMLRENKLKSALIVSSTHHLPRIEAMLNYVQDLDCLRQIAKTVSADEVVIENDPSWKSIIKRAYLCEPILSVIKKEIEGVRQIKSGVYKYK